MEGQGKSSPSSRRRSPRKSLRLAQDESTRNQNEENVSPIPKMTAPGMRKRALSLGGSEEKPELPSPVKKKARMIQRPGRGILKGRSTNQMQANENQTIIGVMQVALNEPKSPNEQTSQEKENRRQSRKSFNRRVSFASHAHVRLIDHGVNATPSPKKSSQSPTTPDEISTPEKVLPANAAATPPLLHFPESSSPSQSNSNNKDSPRKRAISPVKLANISSADQHAASPPGAGKVLKARPSFYVDDEQDHDDSGEATMDLTDSVIPSASQAAQKVEVPEDDDTAAMDLTALIQGPGNWGTTGASNPLEAADAESEMEFTEAVGQVRNDIAFLPRSQPQAGSDNSVEYDYDAFRKQFLDPPTNHAWAGREPISPTRSQPNSREIAADASLDQGNDSDTEMDITAVVPGVDRSKGNPDEETMLMDLTQIQGPLFKTNDVDADETMNMDMTNVFKPRGDHFNEDQTAEMDLTMGVGNQVPGQTVQEDQTAQMDMTTVVGTRNPSKLSQIDESTNMDMTSVFQKPQQVDNYRANDEQTLQMDLTTTGPNNFLYSRGSGLQGDATMDFTRVQPITKSASTRETLNPLEAEDNEPGMEMTTVMPQHRDSVEVASDEDDTAAMEMTMVQPRSLKNKIQRSPERRPNQNSNPGKGLNTFEASCSTSVEQSKEAGAKSSSIRRRSSLSTPRRVQVESYRALDALTEAKTPTKQTTVAADRRKSVPAQLELLGADKPLGSPRAIDRLSKRKSIATMGEMHAQGFGSPYSKVIVGAEEGWQHPRFGATIDRDGRAQEMRAMIATLTPKKKTSARPPSPLKPEIPFDQKSPVKFAPEAEAEDQDRALRRQPRNNDSNISLKEFLDITGISFLDGLTATKRRQTIAFEPLVPEEPQPQDYIRAASVTLPVLELYQFSCKELKKYISEGKDVILRIEEDTLEDNPLLFQEYLASSREVKSIMVNQFKLVKTHARAHAKGVWYEWKTKLLGGLKTVLAGHFDGLESDKNFLSEVSQSLDDKTAMIEERHSSIKKRLAQLRARKEAFQAVDFEANERAQQALEEEKQALQLSKSEHAHVQDEFERVKGSADSLHERKYGLEASIDSCEREIEKWQSLNTLNAGTLSQTFSRLQQFGGWKLISQNATCVCLHLQNTFAVLVDLATGQVVPSIVSPKPKHTTAQSKVWEFCLKGLESRLSLCQSSGIAEKLKSVSRALTIAQQLKVQIQKLDSRYPSEIGLDGNCNVLRVSLRVLLPAARTKIQVGITIEPSVFDSPGTQKAIDSCIHTAITVIYGEGVDVNQVNRDASQKLLVNGLNGIRNSWEIYE